MLCCAGTTPGKIMQLTLYTDYSLRVLLYLAAAKDTVTVAEIAARYGISKNHLVKVVHHLGKLGYVHTERGRHGGIRLAREAGEVRLGALVQDTEPNFHLVECFDPGANRCVIAPACRLRMVLSEAQRAFIETLNRYTLEDITANRVELRNLLESVRG